MNHDRPESPENPGGSAERPTPPEPRPPEPSVDPTETVEAASRGLRMIGDFRIVRQIGAGGMGVVYEAEQQHPKRPVALKVIRGGIYVDENQVRLFQREAQTLARLKHPSIAAIYESGRTPEGEHFFAMELVRGESLGEFIRRRTGHPGWTARELAEHLALFSKICDAVSYAHQRGVIHRDLKPANILVLRDTPSPGVTPPKQVSPEIKILDFGLARITDSDMAVSTILTDLGLVQGTIPYMSPEQIRGNSDEIDLRTDVYSLGVILYEILSGELPYDFKGSALPETMRVICERSPKPLGKVRVGTRNLASDVITIVLKALEKEPGRRYQSAAALADDVQRYLGNQPILARPPSTAYQLRKLVARHKTPFGFAAAMFLLLTGFAVTMALQAERLAHERERANREAVAAKKVSSFLVDLFRVSDPGEARGNTITAREVLDKGAERIQSDLRGQPLVQAKLMHTMAKVFGGLGLPDRARPLLEQAVAVLEDSLPESAELAQGLGDLGTLYTWNGQDSLALPLLERSLAIRRKVFRAGDPDIAYGLAGLGNYYLEVGDHASASTYYEQAAAILERSPNAGDRQYLSWYWNDLGLSRLTLGDYAGAKTYLERALQIKQSILPADHPDIAITEGNLAYLRVRTGEFDRARPILEKVLALREKTLGPVHEQTGGALEALGEVWWRQKDPAQALPLLRRALAIRERYPTGPDLVDLYVTAATLRDLGKYPESEALFKRAVAAHDQAVAQGARHLPSEKATPFLIHGAEWTECLREYAELLRQMGRTREASVLDAQAQAIHTE